MEGFSLKTITLGQLKLKYYRSATDS